MSPAIKTGVEGMLEIKILGMIAITSGTGFAMAQVPGVPDDFGSWSLTAILGFITICAIAAMTYMVKKIFENQAATLEQQKGHDEAVIEQTKEHAKCTAAVQELCARMNKRECLFQEFKHTPKLR